MEFSIFYIILNVFIAIGGEYSNFVQDLEYKNYYNKIIITILLNYSKINFIRNFNLFIGFWITFRVYSGLSVQ